MSASTKYHTDAGRLCSAVLKLSIPLDSTPTTVVISRASCNPRVLGATIQILPIDRPQLAIVVYCTLANLMAMQYDVGYKQGTGSLCLEGGSRAPVAFAPPRTRSVMGMRRMAPGAYGSATVRSVHLHIAGTRHRHWSSPRHPLAPARCLRRAGQFRIARKPCLSCE